MRPGKRYNFMPKTLIGHARCSTDKQDITAQRDALTELGVAADRIYVDHGLTGTNRARTESGACQFCNGDTLVVPKLDRLACSVPGADPSQMNWQQEL